MFHKPQTSKLAESHRFKDRNKLVCGQRRILINMIMEPVSMVTYIFLHTATAQSDLMHDKYYGNVLVKTFFKKLKHLCKIVEFQIYLTS